MNEQTQAIAQALAASAPEWTQTMIQKHGPITSAVLSTDECSIRFADKHEETINNE